jgi:hypothetical protein
MRYVLHQMLQNPKQSEKDYFSRLQKHLYGLWSIIPPNNDSTTLQTKPCAHGPLKDIMELTYTTKHEDAHSVLNMGLLNMQS